MDWVGLAIIFGVWPLVLDGELLGDITWRIGVHLQSLMTLVPKA